MSINYYNEINKNTKVYISKDCKEVAFINGFENFILSKKKEYTLQYSLPQLKNQIIRFIKHDEVNNEFFFVTCLEYDQSLHVMSSSRESF